MFINERFSYAGVNSEDMNVYIGRIGGGLITGQYGLSRSLVKEIIPNVPLSNFFGFDYSPLVFSIQIFSPEPWTPTRKRLIANWLFQNNYQPFYSYDNLDVIYYCMVQGESKFSLTGNSEGYFDITFELNAPFAFSPTIIQSFDLSTNTTTRVITMENQSNLLDYKHYPEIEVTLVGDSTGFTLKNLSNSGLELIFTGLTPLEKIYIDNQNKIIKTDQAGIYRYSKFNKVFMQLVYGINNIQVTGKCTIKVRSKFPVIL